MLSKQELDELEELAEDLIFNATCLITPQEDRAPAIDDLTLQPIVDVPTIKYSGPCKVEPTTRNYERAFDIGETKQASRTYSVRVRKTFTEALINDRIEVTASEDPMFEGMVMTVIDPQANSNATQRILIAEVSLGH